MRAPAAEQAPGQPRGGQFLAAHDQANAVAQLGRFGVFHQESPGPGVQPVHQVVVLVDVVRISSRTPDGPGSPVMRRVAASPLVPGIESPYEIGRATANQPE